MGIPMVFHHFPTMSTGPLADPSCFSFFLWGQHGQPVARPIAEARLLDILVMSPGVNYRHHFLCDLAYFAGEALSYILDDEKLEVTPKRVAMRKVPGCQRFCFGKGTLMIQSSWMFSVSRTLIWTRVVTLQDLVDFGCKAWDSNE